MIITIRAASHYDKYVRILIRKKKRIYFVWPNANTTKEGWNLNRGWRLMVRQPCKNTRGRSGVRKSSSSSSSAMFFQLVVDVDLNFWTWNVLFNNGIAEYFYYYRFTHNRSWYVFAIRFSPAHRDPMKAWFSYLSATRLPPTLRPVFPAHGTSRATFAYHLISVDDVIKPFVCRRTTTTTTAANGSHTRRRIHYYNIRFDSPPSSFYCDNRDRKRII